MNAGRASALAEASVAAILWSALVTGSAVLALTVPVYTSAMSQALGVPQSAGLPPADALRLAGQVRALVADAEYDPLPATFAGQPAFDESAVSHLLDVRGVIGLARLVTGVVALLLATYVGYCVGMRRLDRLSAGMKAGAAVCVAVVAVGVVAALSDFSAFFAAFHGLFFASGTWTFPADSLLIRLFPEPFWIASGAAWAALLVVGAAALLLASRLVLGTRARLSASRTPNNV